MSNTSLVYINAPPPLNYVPCSLLSSTDTHHTVKVTSPITETTVYDAEKDEDIIKLYAAGTTHTVPCSDYRGGVLPLQNTTPTGLPLILPDLISLPALHEPSILTNLTARHLASQPYTSCGTIILAMNPYHRLPELYTSEIRTAINHHYLTTPPPTTSTIMPPHCYQTSAQAYAELLRTGVNQSILVSGESGAGKTETGKENVRRGRLSEKGTGREGDRGTKRHGQEARGWKVKGVGVRDSLASPVRPCNRSLHPNHP